MTRTWQEIAAEAAQEKDAQKLIKLAVELDSALEERDQALHKIHARQRESRQGKVGVDSTPLRQRLRL